MLNPSSVSRSILLSAVTDPDLPASNDFPRISKVSSGFTKVFSRTTTNLLLRVLLIEDIEISNMFFVIR